MADRHFHTYSITDDPKGRLWKCGRWYAYYGDRNIHFSWNFTPDWCSISFHLDPQENEITWGFGIPLIGFFHFTISMPRWVYKRMPWHRSEHRIDGKIQKFEYPIGRQIWLYVHTWALCWSIWTHPDGGLDGFGERLPRWRDGSFDFREFVLGERQYKNEETQPPSPIQILMPEGRYPATYAIHHAEWWFPRWPWWPLRTIRDYIEIDCPVGVPFPGKGENSWDCGEDGLYGSSYNTQEYPTPTDAANAFAATVIKYRRKYGGKNCAADPWPETPAARLASWEQRKAEQRADEQIMAQREAQDGR